MRLNGSFNPEQRANSASIFGSAENTHAANLHLKRGSFEDFIVDAKFRPVEGIVVSDTEEKNSNSKKIDQVQRYSVYARIDEAKRKLKDKQGDQTGNRDARKSRPSVDNDKAVENKKVFQAQLDQFIDDPNLALRKEVSQLRSEIADVKALARSNRDAINALAPMPKPRFQNTYNNPGADAFETSSVSTLSQADLHYLRYGGEQKTLDIWA